VCLPGHKLCLGVQSEYFKTKVRIGSRLTGDAFVIAAVAAAASNLYVCGWAF
jgi:hypothetical protein